MKWIKVKNVMTTVAVTALLTTMIPTTKAVAEETETGEIKRVSLNEVQMDTDSEEELFLEETVQNSETLLLVPGNFYYFVQRTMDQLQLKLANSNEGKAILLTQLANEKLAAAYQLIQVEKYEEAEQIMNEGLEFLESLAGSPEETLETETAAEITVQEDNQGGENQDDSLDEHSVDDSHANVPGYQAVISLLRNIEKVENPNAKATLTNNVLKKLNKLGIDPETVFESDIDENQMEEESSDNELIKEDGLDDTSITDVANVKKNGQVAAPGLQKQANHKSNDGNGVKLKKEKEVKAEKSNNNSKNNRQSNGKGNNGKHKGNGKGNGNK